MRITDRFSSEHDVFLQQLEMLESLLGSGVPTEGIVAAVRTLSLPLFTHAENEELVLFPALEDDLGKDAGPLAVLVSEHETIHGFVERMTSTPSRDEITSVLPAFAGLLREHIAKEEKVLFPAAAQVLSDARLRELDAGTTRALAVVGD